MHRPILRTLTVTAVFAVLVIGSTPVAVAADEDSLSPTGYVYRDVDDAPLPFQDIATILEALRTGEVVERETMSRGVAGNIRMVLEFRGSRFKAVFRHLDRTEREDTPSHRIVVEFRDSYLYEVAAFELSELLGLGRVPPTVFRSIGGRPGSVQIWMERTTPEDIMLDEKRLDPPDTTRWWQQKAMMWVFDALTGNTDRNQGNLLIDDEWNIWFIDHTRAFREFSKLKDADDLNICERRLWQAILDLDDDELWRRLEPSLTSAEYKKLLLRRDRLVRHFSKKIKKLGEDKVLYDYEG